MSKKKNALPEVFICDDIWNLGFHLPQKSFNILKVFVDNSASVPQLNPWSP